MWSPCDATLTDLVSEGCNELLVGDEKSCDPNMASLSTLIKKFLIENKCHPEYHKGLEVDMALWVVKCSDIEVCPLIDDGGVRNNNDWHMPQAQLVDAMVERHAYDWFWVPSDALDMV